MAKYNGTVVLTGMISPTDTNDTYPTHEDILGKGGYRSVSSYEEMTGMAESKIKNGMLVYVNDEDKIYIRHYGVWQHFSDGSLDTSLFVYKTDAYLKTEVDNLLDLKSDKVDTYSKMDVDEFNFESKSNKGQINGYAALDSNGKVPTDQLPLGVSIIEVPSTQDLPIPGKSGVLYTILDSNDIYRWDSSVGLYNKVTIKLGVTSETAFRGDLGDIAYQHTLKMDNPHNVTAGQINVYTKDTTNSIINAHISSINLHNIS